MIYNCFCKEDIHYLILTNLDHIINNTNNNIKNNNQKATIINGGVKNGVFNK